MVCTVKAPAPPPAPLTRTQSPGSIFPDVPWKAMTPACGRLDASAKLTVAGLWTMGAVSGTETYWEVLPPWYMTSPNTSSPGRKDSMLPHSLYSSGDV
jgi:hypothetical protein